METLFLLTIVLFGLLVILQVIPLHKVGRYLTCLILLFIFGPVVYGISRSKTTEFFSQSHHWWEYLVFFFLALIVLRIILNLIFPGRRS